MTHCGKAKKYSKEFLDENMMGPNSLTIVEELTQEFPLESGMKVLDLGCGRGLTSIFLAKEYDVTVFATDLWVSATDNLKRFQQLGVSDRVIPLHLDALSLPFADNYFDVVISVDSYHYFGNNDRYFAEKILPLLKPGGMLGLAFPGMKVEVHEKVPSEMKPFWDEEALPLWQSMEWWAPKFEEHLLDFNIWEMHCFDEAWDDWLSSGNPYAEEDKPMMEADGGRYMNLIGLTGRIP